MSKFILAPEWQLEKSHNPKRPDFWAANTVMGNVCIFKNRAGHYYASADFIHYPNDGREYCVGLSSIPIEDPMLSRFEICTDPEQLKAQINSIHLEQIRKFIQFQKIVLD